MLLALFARSFRWLALVSCIACSLFSAVLLARFFLSPRLLPVCTRSLCLLIPSLSFLAHCARWLCPLAFARSFHSHFAWLTFALRFLLSHSARSFLFARSCSFSQLCLLVLRAHSARTFYLRILLAYLCCSQVAGASLDVYPSEPPPPELKELIMHPKVVCSPHLGASTQDAQVTSSPPLL